MINLEEKLKSVTQQTNAQDIHEHLPILKDYASRCWHVTEMGVRQVVSTWAFLAGKPATIRSYDMTHPRKLNAGDVFDEAVKAAKENNIDWRFIEQDVLEAHIAQTDLLFIDTWHVYKQLRDELKMHSPKVNKWIILHDTTARAYSDEVGYDEVYGEKFANPTPIDKPQGIGLWPAVEEFLHANRDDWRLLERFHNCQGLTILERITNKRSY